MEESNRLKEKYFPTFAFFEYRKIIRRLGGEMFEKATNPLIIVAIVFLWLAVFLISNVSFDGSKLVFIFFEYPSNPSIESKFVAWIYSATVLQNGLLVLIAVYWQIRSICEIFLFILFITFVITFSAKGS